MTEDQAKATVSIALLEAAMTLTGQASTEGPKGTHSIGCDIADLNRKIMALQQRLIGVVDGQL